MHVHIYILMSMLVTYVNIARTTGGTDSHVPPGKAHVMIA